jgi:hypothetical protein
MEAPATAVQYRTYVQSFIRNADAFFRGINPRPVSCKLDVSLCSELMFLLDIYSTKNFNGIVLGESHKMGSPKKFIIDNLPALAAMGVKTLFLEEPYDWFQPAFDFYYASKSAELPPGLGSYLNEIDRLNKLTGDYTYTALVRKAKQAGIRVVGFDTGAARMAYFGGFSSSLMAGPIHRLQAMNYAAFAIIRHEKGKGKYLVLTGAYHGSTQTIGDKTIPGLSELLQCPYMLIGDRTGEQRAIADIDDPNFSDASFSRGAFRHVHLYQYPTPRRAS